MTKPRVEFLVLIVVGTSLFAWRARAQTPEPPSVPPASTLQATASTAGDRPQPYSSHACPSPVAVTDARRKVGAGYKIGDGLGYIGADLIFAPLPHLVVDLQGSWFNRKLGASGFGVAPAYKSS